MRNLKFVATCRGLPCRASKDNFESLDRLRHWQEENGWDQSFVAWVHFPLSRISLFYEEGQAIDRSLDPFPIFRSPGARRLWNPFRPAFERSSTLSSDATRIPSLQGRGVAESSLRRFIYFHFAPSCSVSPYFWDPWWSSLSPSMQSDLWPGVVLQSYADRLDASDEHGERNLSPDFHFTLRRQ